MAGHAQAAEGRPSRHAKMAYKAAVPTSPFRDDVLAGRVVLITGGATGIGLGCSETFGRHGAKVAILARRKEVIDLAVDHLQDQGIDAFGVQGDVRDFELCEKSVAAVIAHFGRLDFLINNAAGNFMVSAEELTPNGLSTVLGIDLQGMFHMSKACLPHMKTTGPTDGACIINITATLQDRATPFQAHAASAKAGIDVFTNTLGAEWAEYGIRVVGLAPGGVAGTVGGPGGRVFSNDENKTSSNAVGSAESIDLGEPSPEEVRRTGTPAGRWGRVDDIALSALFMCSSAASWITATRLVIDGGQSHGVKSFVEVKEMIKAKSMSEKKVTSGGIAKKTTAKL